MDCRTMRAVRMLDMGIRKQIVHFPVTRELDSMTGMHCWIIGYLADRENEDIYQRDLEKEFGSCRSTISKMLAAMEHNGLVERARVSSDDRLKKIVLTPLAKQYIGQIRAEKKDEYEKLFNNPYQAAQKGYIEDIIEPRNTRFRVIRALESLKDKRQELPAKKHDNLPL